MLFWIHTISSVIAMLLIIWLSLSCILKKLKGHKVISVILIFVSLISIISISLYGFTLEFTLTWVNSHNLTGFASLILSITPIFAFITKKDKWHYNIGYLASIMAVTALITGLIAYTPLMLSYFAPEETGCFELFQLNDTSDCLVAVDGIIYDMTGMPRWGSGKHYDYICGGNYSKEEVISIMPSHAADKYYGPAVGRLC